MVMLVYYLITFRQIALFKDFRIRKVDEDSEAININIGYNYGI